ncbi:MAG: DUF3592 domain-containing protein [Candidatus Melainabacteria bacterium]|nr:DUF3592 domain-containing protein [Candidatus Melainabacteria bacterium]
MSQFSRKFEKPFLISLLLGALLVFALVDLPPYIHGINALNWPQTKGTIDSFDSQFYTIGRDPAWTPKVQYHYKVNDTEFTSDRISFQPPIGIPGYESGQFSEKYKVANEVKVFYDPKNPKQACLENTPSLTIGIAHLVAYLIFVFIVYLSVYPKIDDESKSQNEVPSSPKIEPEPQT